MRILLTGGAGFIGSHAVRHFLERGDHVVVLDKFTYAGNLENLKKYNGDDWEFVAQIYSDDICDMAAVENVCSRNSFDVIVNFAAETHVDNSIKNCDEFIRTNVQGTTNLLNTAKKWNIKFCHISTDEVYGPATLRKFSEYDKLNPMNPYAASKSAADLMVFAYHNTYGLPYLVVRPSNNYGPRQHKEKFLPKLIQSIKDRKKFPLYGDGLQRREWTHAGDTVRIIRDLLELGDHVWNDVYNVSSGIEKKNLEMVRQVIGTMRQLGHDVDHLTCADDAVEFVTDRPGHDKRYLIDTSELEVVLGKKPAFTNLDDGLLDTVKSYL